MHDGVAHCFGLLVGVCGGANLRHGSGSQDQEGKRGPIKATPVPTLPPTDPFLGSFNSTALGTKPLTLGLLGDM